MARKFGKSKVDTELDLHGYTAAEARVLLQSEWPAWRGMRAVRVIHGRGDVLRAELGRWCREMGIPFRTEENNPGSALLFPIERESTGAELRITLRDKGLNLTPDQEAELRDPEAVKKARLAEIERRLAEERKRQQTEMQKMLAKRRDEALWAAEVARLDGMEKKRSGKIVGDRKPAAPAVRPPSEIKHQEGWWKAELVRVADTAQSVLNQQKKTGLDKLAPPIIAKKPEQSPGPKKAPQRNFDADNALFEAALQQLDD